MQNPYFELLKELTEICEKNKIEYCLAGKILYFISEPNRKMPEDFTDMELVVDGKNARKLIQACETLPEGRVLETPLRNPKFRNLDMFYIHTNTTGVDFSILDRREFLGINIPIRIIRPDMSKMQNKIYKKMDVFWRVNYGYHYSSVLISEKEERMWKTFDSFCGNGDKITAMIFRMNLKTSLEDAAKKVFVYGRRFLKEIPAGLLKDTQKAEIEGTTFTVMECYDKYMSIFAGKNWRDKVFDKPRLIIDTGYVDREFEKALYHNDDFWKRKVKFRKSYMKYRLGNRAYELSWEMAGCVYRGINIENRLSEQKEVLNHMLELHDYTGVLYKMKRYKHVLVMHNKYDVELDQELFDIYSQAKSGVAET